MKEELLLDNLEVIGDYIKDDRPVIFVANHRCIRDGFYIPKAINDKVVALASSNSVYKVAYKEDFMNKYLYLLPIEIYGDYRYTNKIIESSIELLKDNINILIFPEGVYSSDLNINRAHTSVSRIIIETKKRGIDVHLVPISLNIIGKEKDKASVDFNDEIAYVKFLKEIDINPFYNRYMDTNNYNEKKIILHELIDTAMIKIADDIKVNYNSNYKNYVEKDSIYTINGELLDISILKEEDYFLKYCIDLEERVNSIKVSLNDIKRR